MMSMFKKGQKVMFKGTEPSPFDGSVGTVIDVDTDWSTTPKTVRYSIKLSDSQMLIARETTLEQCS